MRTIKYTNQVSLVFPSRSANESFARSAAAAFAAQLDPTLDEVGDVKTAVSEAVTNAIVHAYPDSLGKVELKLRLYAGERVWSSLSGTGAWALPTWNRPGLPSSPQATRSAPAWASPLWRASWTALKVALRTRGRGPPSPCASGSPSRAGGSV